MNGFQKISTSEYDRLKIWGERSPYLKNLILSEMKFAGIIFGGGLLLIVLSDLVSYLNLGYIKSDLYDMSIMFAVGFFVLAIILTLWKLFVTDLYGYYELEGSNLVQKIIFNHRRIKFGGSSSLTSAALIMIDSYGMMVLVWSKDSNGNLNKKGIFFWNQSDNEIERIIKTVESVAGKSIPTKRYRKLSVNYQRFLK